MKTFFLWLFGPQNVKSTKSTWTEVIGNSHLSAKLSQWGCTSQAPQGRWTQGPLPHVSSKINRTWKTVFTSTRKRLRRRRRRRRKGISYPRPHPIFLKASETLPVCFLRGGAIDAWLRINSWKNFLLSSSIGLWIYKTSSYCILKIHLTYTYIHTKILDIEN